MILKASSVVGRLSLLRQGPRAGCSFNQAARKVNFHTTPTRFTAKQPLQTYQTFHPPWLYNKVAIVTGASSGLGRAIALQYASHGTRLVVCADLQPSPRSEEDETISGPTHEVIRSTYGDDKSIFVKTDVNNTQDVQNMVRSAVDNTGCVDMYVCVITENVKAY